MKMNRRNQKGTALIFALIFLLILSVMAASLMFLAQSETWTSSNYRMMTQGRYGAEAGINSTANYLMFTYAPPGGAGDPLANYDMTQSPVKNNANGLDVVLSTTLANSNYPNAAVAGDFAHADTGLWRGELYGLRQAAVHAAGTTRRSERPSRV